MDSYSQIASDFRLWGEYFDTSAEMSRDEFEAMSLVEKIALLESAFSAEGGAA